MGAVFVQNVFVIVFFNSYTSFSLHVHSHISISQSLVSHLRRAITKRLLGKYKCLPAPGITFSTAIVGFIFWETSRPFFLKRRGLKVHDWKTCTVHIVVYTLPSRLLLVFSQFEFRKYLAIIFHLYSPNAFSNVSLGQYVQAFQTHPNNPLHSLCIGLTFFHMASQKYVAKRHTLVLQVRCLYPTPFFW